MSVNRDDEHFKEIFRLLSNETRLEILWALWDEHDIDISLDPEPVPFSRLKERVGMRDSGQFNYHLSQMVPALVRDHDEGYTLAFTGNRIIGAIIAGNLEGDDPIALPSVGDCPHTECQGTLATEYTKEHLVFECDSCDLRSVSGAPPNLVDAHDLERDSGVLERYLLTAIQMISRGFCPVCRGPLTAAFHEPPATTDDLRIERECHTCGFVSNVSATLSLVDHPAVIALLHDNGVDYREFYFLRASDAVDSTWRVRETEPTEVEVDISTRDGTLTLVLDERTDVIDYSRTA